MDGKGRREGARRVGRGCGQTVILLWTLSLFSPAGQSESRRPATADSQGPRKAESQSLRVFWNADVKAIIAMSIGGHV